MNAIAVNDLNSTIQEIITMMIGNTLQEQLDNFMQGLKRRNPGEHEFHQAVYEVAATIIPYIFDKPIYQEADILERLTEPDRVISFRVCWEDDKGNVRTNRGYRVQHSNAIGPYKGGIRFHHDLTVSVLKFLAFEQTFKNSLTGLPMGGAKGGSNFNPKGKSDREVMRFCQAFMTELARHIGPFTDVPAGDIGVGAREISYMFGQYKRIANEFTGALTGKGLAFGGSLIRTEATGYGAVYMMEEMLKHHDHTLDGKTAVVSGSGNVAQYTVEKLIQLGAKVVTLSDSSGFIHDPDGINEDKLTFVKELKQVKRGRISEYAEEFGVKFHANQRPWSVPCDIAFPCATQNELNGKDAGTLVKNGCIAVSEGANMPTEQQGINTFMKAKTLFAPSKAANAGGVAVSGLEMTQNSMRLSWSREELDQRLRQIMTNIHAQCVEYGTEVGPVNYLKGANIAGFIKVADAMLAYGVI
jgi:glutamate dehydrogenase (NADP+)